MNRSLRKIFFLLAVNILTSIIFSDAKAQSCNCSYTINPSTLYLKGDSINIQPGDTVCIQNGVRPYLGLTNFHGTADKPIVFINCGGAVVISNDNFYYGMRFDNCSYFKVTGTGVSSIEYGIQILKTGWSGIGLTIDMMSTDFEVDHLEISYTGFAGLMAKSDPDCGGLPNRGNFIQYNTRIHDNYIHDTGGEGIYVGFPHYRGIRRECNGDSIWVYPHDIIGLEIYNNSTFNTGREGIQVGCAVKDVKIYNNTVENFGVKNVQWQRGGIHLSTGTTGLLYNNRIYNGTGMGIWLNGFGDNHVFNNIIYNIGEDGILAMDSLVQPGTSYYIWNNTITKTGNNGITLMGYISNGNMFCNNIIAGLGGTFADFSIANPVTSSNNLMTRDLNDVQFVGAENKDFRLKEESPAIDAGMDGTNYRVTFDHNNTPRPLGNAFDIGAFESQFERKIADFIVYPNPFSVESNILFTLQNGDKVSLHVYDEHGRVIEQYFENKDLPAGIYLLKFQRTDIASAMYYCHLVRGKRKATRKMVLEK